MKIKNTVVEIISFLLIMLYIYAATSKWIDFSKFKAQLSQSPVVSPFSSLFAWSIPVLEVILSVMLMVPYWKTAGLYGSFALMTMFCAYIIAITHYSEFIPCSCGGVLEHMSWNAHFIFNLCFVVMTALAIIIKPAHQIQNHQYE